MEIKKCILTNNDCYKKGQKITPKGIVVHSTGANNPYLKRYVQPDDGFLGVNKYNNHWNRPNHKVCVHAFIGKDKDGIVRCYQTLPFDIACWGVGSGSKGSYNYNPAYIQFEICEDNLKDKEYFTKAFDVASDFCAFLVKQYGISIDNVISHKEAHSRGYGSNHADCDHWLKKFGKTMNDFRKEVKSKVDGPEKKEPVKKEPVKEVANTYTVKKGDSLWKIAKEQLGNGSKYKEIATLNNIKGNLIYAGQVLKLPQNKAITSTPKKSVEEIAKEVIKGKWGNGQNRKTLLEKAGYNYSEVQKKVNELLK